MHRPAKLSKRILLSGLFLAWIFMAGGVQLLLSNAMAKETNEVTVYLHSGTDRTGTMTAFDGKTITLKTKSGTEAIPRKSYQGLVLNTPSEKAISEKLAKDIGSYMEAGKFTYDHRTRIKQALDKNAPACKTLKNFPWVHFTVAPNQTVTNVTLLSSSSCPALDAHLVKTIQSVKPPSIQSIGVPFFPMNYIYEPKGFVYDAKQDKRPHPKHPDDLKKQS
jgi:hypothetical protein